MMKIREGYKETEIGVIPEEWEVSKLDEYISIKHGFAFKGEFFTDKVTSNFVLTPGNFKMGGGFNQQKSKYYEENAEVPSDYVLNEDDLIVTMTDLNKDGGTLGYPALVPQSDNKRYLHNQRIGKIVFNYDDIYKHYLFYLLCSSSYRRHIMATASGTTVNHTSPSKIIDFVFPKPTIIQQQRIAEILSTTDEHIEKLDKTIEDYQLLKKGMMRKLLTEGIGHTEFKETEIGRIPKEWEVEEVDKTFQKQTKRLIKQFKTNEYQECGNYPIIDQGKEFISGFTNDVERIYMGELPIVIFGDHTRNLKYIDFKFAVGADGTQILKPISDKFNAKFYYYALKNISLVNQGYHRHFKFLKESKISIPRIHEQNEITLILDVIDDRQRIFIQQKQDFIQLKKALMQKLLTGEIRTI